MRYTHIQQSDLNLLVSLQALVEERSVGRAARRVFLSQSAMSRVLDRLRGLFKDELLVRTGRGYEPTHRALHIYAELEQFLPPIEQLLRGEEFNPAQAIESFRIAASDQAAVILLPALMEAVSRTAPGIQFEIFPVDDDVFRKLEINALDLALWVNEAPPTLRAQPLFREKIVCLVRTGHPLGKRRLTLARYLEQNHVVVSLLGGRQGLVEQALDRLGYRRKVQLRIPYFGAVGAIVERTDLVATLPKRLAKRLTTLSKTRILPAPIEFQEFTYIQAWHPRYDSDPAHQWLRELIRKASA